MNTSLPRYIVALLILSMLGLAVSCSSSSKSTRDRAALTEAGAEAECQCECPCAEEDEDKGVRAEGAEPREWRESNIIPIADSPIRGAEDAPVTIVVFSDLQCPFCQRGAQTMDKLLADYPDKIRLVFKHNPLPFHKQADEAAKAALAAREQGDEYFWEMHDIFFENRKALKNVQQQNFLDWAVTLAARTDMDVNQFREDYKQNGREYQDIIERDMALGKELRVRGVPHFFINGERVKGAKGYSAFETIIRRQIDKAEDMMDAGVDPSDVYAKAVKSNYNKRPEPRKPKKKATKIAYVPVEDDDPVAGNNEDPLVTIVEFSDFQCPFCKKVNPTLEKVKEEYGDQVRIVFKQYPLPFHKQADMAAEISLAAAEQGKFWEMHDLLFEKQRDMKGKDDDAMIDWGVSLAKQLNLDTDKFRKALESDRYEDEVDEDMKLASDVGSRGTPNFWINGVNFVGAQPYSAFEEVIDEQVALARKVKEDKDLSGEELYKAVVELNEKQAGSADKAAGPDKPKPVPKVDESKLEIGDAPVKGPANAEVTVMMFSDFECPYCRRGKDNLEDAVAEFDGKVKVVYKHFPLPFHKQARPAAKAAMAAAEQGKFWEMHDLLFDNQKRLRESGVYVDLAKELGLDIEKFKKDMKRDSYDDTIDANMEQGKKVGVRGTPAFFINGRRIVGAQPTQRFEQVIEDALEE